MPSFSFVLARLQSLSRPDPQVDALIRQKFGGSIDLPFTSSIQAVNILIKEYMPGLVMQIRHAPDGLCEVSSAYSIYMGEERIVISPESPIIATPPIAYLIALMSAFSFYEDNGL